MLLASGEQEQSACALLSTPNLNLANSNPLHSGSSAGGAAANGCAIGAGGVRGEGGGGNQGMPQGPPSVRTGASGSVMGDADKDLEIQVWVIVLSCKLHTVLFSAFGANANFGCAFGGT